MTNQEPDKNLERLIHERLRALPDLPAPPELIPNVLQKIAAQKSRVWWRCPWPEWPRGMQIISAVLFSGVLGVTFAFQHEILEALRQLAGRLADGTQFLKPLLTLLEALAGVLQLLASSIKSQFLVIGTVIIAMLYLSTIGLGTVFYRVVAGTNQNLK